MAPIVRNSHYVARHLTRPWEFTHPRYGARQLWFYDFGRDEFGVSSSRNFYTTEQPWSDDVEAFLNTYVETPLSQFLGRYHASRREAEPTQVELRALKLAVLLQLQRSEISGDLVRTAALPELELNSLVAASDDVYQFVHVPLRQERLLFPDTGTILVPLAGSAPGVALALHPSFLTITVPLPAEGYVRQIEELRRDEDNITAFSVGTASSHRVVMPGSLWGKHSEEAMRAGLHQFRNIARSHFRATFRRNLAELGELFPPPIRARAL